MVHLLFYIVDINLLQEDAIIDGAHICFGQEF